MGRKSHTDLHLLKRLLVSGLVAVSVWYEYSVKIRNFPVPQRRGWWLGRGEVDVFVVCRQAGGDVTRMMATHGTIETSLPGFCMRAHLSPSQTPSTASQQSIDWQKQLPMDDG